MTYEERRTTVTEEPVDRVDTGRSVTEHTVTAYPSGGEIARRIIVLLFGLIQIIIGLRILLLLADARQANQLVRGILDLSQIFVAPFEGIFRTDALQAGGSVLDVAAIAAFVGWTILELIALWSVSLFRREAV